MSSCIKCVKCNKCSCNCICVKDDSKANWDWDAFQKVIQGYSPASKKNEFDKLPKRFSLSIIDNGIDAEWEIEYRTNINIIELSNILNDYFGIESDVFPRFSDDFGVVGFIDEDGELDEE